MAKPPVFRDVTYEQALQQAAAEDRWAVVVATAASSELGLMMDKTTWRDKRICAWLEEKAVAVQVDVGEDELLGRRLKAVALPTVIVFRDGAEKARLAGFLDARHLLLWLLSVVEGQKTRLRSILRKKDGDLEHDMHGRLSYARALLGDESYDEATGHYAWMWDNMSRVEPSMSGVRVSFMAGDMERLAVAHGPARERFAALRDRAAGLAEAEPASVRSRLDWVVLNKIVGDEDRTLAWFDGVKADPGSAPVVEGISRFLGELLKARGRWADLGRLHSNPLKELGFQHEMVNLPELPGLSAEASEKMRGVMVRQFRSAAAELFASLRAAGRGAEARAVQEEALRLDPSDEMRLALEQSPTRYD